MHGSIEAIPLVDTSAGPSLAEDINEVATLHNLARFWNRRAAKSHTEKASAESRRVADATALEALKAQDKLRDRMLRERKDTASTLTHVAHLEFVQRGRRSVLTAVVEAKGVAG